MWTQALIVMGVMLISYIAGLIVSYYAIPKPHKTKTEYTIEEIKNMLSKRYGIRVIDKFGGLIAVDVKLPEVEPLVITKRLWYDPTQMDELMKIEDERYFEGR